METEFRRLDRTAFYALASGGWRDLVTLLHPPYTALHLSYVALGAAASTTLHAGPLVATLAAFFLAVGVSAHPVAELTGRSLQTTLRRRTLIGLAVVGLGGAVGMGVAGTIIVSLLLAPLVLVEVRWYWHATLSSRAGDCIPTSGSRLLAGGASRRSPVTSRKRSRSAPRACSWWPVGGWRAPRSVG
jgi:hypothetical protein